MASATGLFKIGTGQPFVIDSSWGRPAAALVIAGALARFLWPRRPPLGRSVWLFLAMPVGYWTVLSLAARIPNIAGYQYTNVMLLLLAVAALSSGVRIPRLAGFALAAGPPGFAHPQPADPP